jgi:peptidoglycan/LPS O-acetylase OafA/YrhL
LAIRGIAALIVAIGHCWAVFLLPFDSDSPVFRTLGGLAAWAVATFFILSGMVIASSVKRRSSSGQFGTLDYLIARTLRIFPPLLAAVVITVGSVLIIQWFNLYGAESYRLVGDEAVVRERAIFDWPSVLRTATLTYNLLPGEFLIFDGPLWSLSYEYWLYVLAGLLCAASINKSWAAAALALVLMVLMALAPPSNLPFWCVGLVWGAGYAVGWFWPSARSLDWRLVVGAMLACLIGAVLIARRQLVDLLVTPYGPFQANAFYLAACGVILCGLVLLINMPALRTGTRLPLRLAARVGRFSYTLYLVHFPLLLLALSLFRPMVLGWGFAGHALLAVAVFVAVLLAAERLARVVENTALMRLAVERLLEAAKALAGAVQRGS